MAHVLLITGASKGIGLATAAKFAEQGHRIVNISRTPCPLPEARNLAIDLGDPSWAAQHGESVLETTQGAEQISLVHNAAVMTKESVHNISGDTLSQVLQLNVVAAAQLNTLLLPSMKDGSSIVYISSTLGRKAVANTHAYVISKHAVIGQMRATCQDLAGSQIHTAAICPGFTETEMLQEHLGSNPALRDEINASIALGRIVQPQEIADTVWFCSQTPAINGAILDANNGQIEH